MTQNEKTNRKRGGQPGNKNALKHGFYSQENIQIRKDLEEMNKTLSDIILKNYASAHSVQ